MRQGVIASAATCAALWQAGSSDPVQVAHLQPVTKLSTTAAQPAPAAPPETLAPYLLVPRSLSCPGETPGREGPCRAPEHGCCRLPSACAEQCLLHGAAAAAGGAALLQLLLAGVVQPVGLLLLHLLPACLSEALLLLLLLCPAPCLPLAFLQCWPLPKEGPRRGLRWGRRG